MNLDQIASNVQRDLDDLSANFFKLADDIYPSIQDGYDLVAALCETIESTANVSFGAGQVYYDLKSSIPSYLRVFGIYNNNTNRWLEPCTLGDLLKTRDDWECAEGTPYWFWPIDWRHIAIFPAYAAATGNFTVLFKATADQLVIGGAEPTIPLSEHNVLQYYADSDLLTQAQEWVKALDYAKLMDATIEQIIKIVRNRQRPNHLYYKHG